MAALSASSCEAWVPPVTGAESASLWTATFLVDMHFHNVPSCVNIDDGLWCMHLHPGKVVLGLTQLCN